MTRTHSQGMYINEKKEKCNTVCFNKAEFPLEKLLYDEPWLKNDFQNTRPFWEISQEIPRTPVDSPHKATLMQNFNGFSVFSLSK